MFTHYRTEAVILKKIDRGEADLLLVAYTREFGRLEIVARSARKISSKLRPAVEFPAIVELEFIQGKACKTLTDAVILIPLTQARRDAVNRETVCRIADLSEILIKDQQPDIKVWELVRLAVVLADAADRQNIGAVYQHYVWHLFEALGWRPEFGRQSAGTDCRSLVCFFRDSDIERSVKMRLTGRQSDALDEVARKYLELVTK